MRYDLLSTLLLHVFPFFVCLITWKKPAQVAEEKIVRFQIVASLVYFFVYPITTMLDWPGFQLSSQLFIDILGQWYGEGVWGSLRIISSAVVTALIIFIRRKIKKS